jgi:AcrR family transcriptional regulator
VTLGLAPEPATAKAQRTRRQILEASLALFKEQGFDRASMRDIAARAGLSLGSTYYYFRSKDELVLAFYAETHAAAWERSERTRAETGGFVDRLRDVLLFKLEQLAEYRGFIVVLARSALEPSQPLSPFGRETKALRDGAVAIMERTLEGSDLRVHRELRPHLPRLLWLLQMGLVFFWIHDASPGQERTRRVVEASLALVSRLLALTAARLPGVSKIVSLVAVVLDELAFWEDRLGGELGP